MLPGVFPGDAMNQRNILLYGPGQYPRRGRGFYQATIKALEDMNREVDR